MIKRHENKISMLEGVNAYITEHEYITSDNAGILIVNEDLGRKIEEIKNSEVVRTTVFKGKTIAKNINRGDVINLGFEFASKLFDYGVRSGNAELKSQSDFNRSEMDKMRDTELLVKLQIIADNLDQNINALSSYGITREKADHFKQKTDEFRNIFESKLTSQAIKSSARKTVSVLFREADLILKSLDMMVEAYQKTNKQFYNGYKFARSIKNLGKRYRQPREQMPEQIPEQLPEQIPDQVPEQIPGQQS